MKQIVWIITAMALAGCERPDPRVDDATMAHIRQTLPGMTDTCARAIRFGGLEAMPAQIGRCVEMSPRQRWAGTWHNAFEGSAFCETQVKCGFDDPVNETWLSFNDADARRKYKEGSYQIEFLGRKTGKQGMHGHMGLYGHQIIVDQVISIRKL